MADRWAATVLALGLTLAVGLAPAAVAASSDAGDHGGHESMATDQGSGMGPMDVRVTVRVSRHGFDGSRDGLRLAVGEGTEVTLTFEFAEAEADRENPHVFLIQGYDLRTARLDPANPRATVSFRADRAGTFTIRCILPCQGHSNLQTGRLTVEGAPGASPAAVPLAVGLSAVATRADPGAFTLVAAVTDDAGRPLPGVRVVFYEEAAFLGADGWAELGRALTGDGGLARLDVAFRREGEVTVAARAVPAAGPGGPAAPAGEARITLAVAGPLPGYQPAPLGLGVPFFTPKLIWLVAAGVWVTYAAAMRQVYVIAREGRQWARSAMTTADTGRASHVPAEGGSA